MICTHVCTSATQHLIPVVSWRSLQADCVMWSLFETPCMCINYPESGFFDLHLLDGFITIQKNHAAAKLKQPLRLDLAVFVYLTNVMNIYSKNN